MKFSAETSNGTSLEVEADLNDAVFDAKKRRVEKVQGADVYLASQQMLIHQGKVLNDTTKLGENNVADNSYLSIMLSEEIPEQADIPPVVRRLQTTAAPPTSWIPLTEAPQATTAQANGPTTSVTGGPTDEPNNKPAAAGASSASPAPASQRIRKRVTFSEAEQTIPVPTVDVDLLVLLRNIQQSQELRAMVDEFFMSLEPTFKELQNKIPELMTLVQDHACQIVELIYLLVERVEGERGLLLMSFRKPPDVSVTPEEGEANVSATPEEVELIDALSFLGDIKNETAALEYLRDRAYLFV